MILDISSDKLNPVQTDLPTWPCPSCYSGSIRKVTSFSEREDRESRAISENTGDRVYRGLFSGILECDNPKCGQLVGIVGTKYSADELIDASFKLEHTNRLEILYLSPSPHFFRLDHRVPEKARGAFSSAFDLYWIDIHSCANKIRLALECVMQDQGFIVGALHTRIEQFSKVDEKNSKLGNAMMALKWLGNSGSHIDDRGLDRGDVIKGFKVMAITVKSLYCDDSEQLQDLVNYLNLKHNPKSM